MRCCAPASACARSPAATSSGVPDSPGPVGAAAVLPRLRIAHRNADRDRQRGRVPADPLARLDQLAADPGQALVRVAEPGEVPGIGVTRGQLEHARTLGRDEDRQVGPGGRQQHGVARRHVPPVQVGPSLADEPGDDRQRLLEPSDLVIGRVAERLELRVVPASPDPEDQPPAADLVEGGRHLGLQRGVAERACTARSSRARPGWSPRRWPPGSSSTRGSPTSRRRQRNSRWSNTHDRIEPGRLDRERDLADRRIGLHARAVVLVRDRQHDPDPHPSVRTRASRHRDLRAPSPEPASHEYRSRWR